MAIDFTSVGTLNGTADADFLFSGGTTVLNGGDGFDILFGDVSTALFGAQGGTSLEAPQDINDSDSWIIMENPLLGDMTVPSTMILFEPLAGETFFFSFTVAAGETITVDVDTWGASNLTPTRPNIAIFDPAGAIVSFGNPVPATGEGLGSRTPESYATHVALTSGTYIVRIIENQQAGEIDNTFDGGEQFIVNLSVTGHPATGQVLAMTNDTLNGGNGDDLLLGIGGDDLINGDAGNDQLDGGAGNDSMFGGDGFDVINGGGGVDHLFGGAGNDTLIADAGDFILDGGDGNDRVDLSRFGSGVSVDLAAGLVQSALPVDIILTSIEEVIGTAFADVLIGDTGNNFFVGGADGDTISGGDGSDTVDYSASEAGIFVLLNSGIAGGGHAQGDVLQSIENVIATDFNDLIFGNDAANTIRTGRGSDTVHAGGGDDAITVGGRPSIVYGGSGNDTIRGTSDTIPSAQGTEYAGEEGDDHIILISIVESSAMPDAGLFIVDGGSGIDTLTVQFGPLTLDMTTGATHDLRSRALNFENVTGGTFADSITGTDGSNVIRGERGNDTIFAAEGDDTAIGGDDNDVLSGGIGSDSLDGGFGNDSIQGNDGADTIFASFGNDTVNGGFGSDTIDGFSGADSLAGGNLADTINGGTENDTISGGLGLDLLSGDAGDDIINGDAGSDTITGGAGNDTLDGGNQFDTLNGGDGDDVIAGGLLRDVSTGGAGADTFRYNVNDFGTGLRAGADRITDFSQAQGDRIDLSLIDASTSAAGNNAFSFIGPAAFVNDGVGGRLRFVQQGGNTFVEGDRNGDGVADFAIQLDGLLTLGSADFVL